MSGNTFLLVVLLVVAYYFIKRARSPLRAIPGPSGLPLIGQTVDIIRSDAGSKEFEYAMKYGPVLKYSFLGETWVLVTDAEFVKYVTITNEHNYSKRHQAYIGLKEQIGDGLVTMTDIDQHKHSRAMLTGAFTYSNLKLYFPIFTEMTQQLLDNWSGLPKINLHQEVTNCTLDIIGRAAFGVDLGTMKAPPQATKAHQSPTGGAFILQLLQGTFNDFKGPGLMDLFPFLKPLSSAHRRQVRSTTLLSEEMTKIIDRKHVEVDADGQRGVQSEGKLHDLLDVLIKEKDEEGNGLSTEALIAQAKTFLLAGHETTATTLSWAFVVLSENPDVERKLAEEVLAKLGPYDPAHKHAQLKTLTADVIDGMKYLNKFIKELLRYYPPISLTIRRCENDDVIKGYFIPAGTVVAVSPFIMHRHPALWTEPERFDPDRWDEAFNPPVGAYMPFWLGSRNCIGMKFALLETKTVLAMIIQRYRLRFPPDHPKLFRDFAVTMRPNPSPCFFVEPRESPLSQ